MRYVRFTDSTLLLLVSDPTTHFCIYRAFVMDFVGHYLFFLCAPKSSCVIVCVPVSLKCIQIALCRTSFANTVYDCAFAMALNRPLLEIFQYRALSMARIGLYRGYRKLSHPVSLLCPNCRVFMGYFL